MSSPSPSDFNRLDLSGRQLKDFLLLRLLGRGGMAAVYLAEQKSLQRPVAVKILKPALALEESYLRRFRREAQAAAALVHPHIVQIYEIGCDENYHFIAQEYVPGYNLKQLFSKRLLAAEEAMAILQQVAAALQKSETHRIVHRDIKPENILVANDGVVKVADFGLARVVAERGQLELTQIGMTMGTPLYMSPEQVEGRELDTRSDIYSLGVTAYQLFAGRPPFDGENAIALAVQQLQQEPIGLDVLRPDLDRALVELIHQMLRKNPEERPSATQLLEHLQALPRSAQGAGGSEAISPTASLLSLGRLESTRRLAGLLARNAPEDKARSSRHRGWLAAVLALSILWGAGWAVLRFPSDPLREHLSRTSVEVPRLDSLQTQFLYASGVNSVAAWRSVLEFAEESPSQRSQDEYFVNVARQQLAVIFLRREQWAEARQHFLALTRTAETERFFRALGFAGQFAIAVAQGQWTEAERFYAAFLPLRKDFDVEGGDALMGGQLADAEKRLAAHNREFPAR